VETSLKKILKGYDNFRKKYACGDQSVMQHLSEKGQHPKIMVVACCDSRVDPGLILQCDPGDLFVVRNVANIVPPYEHDGSHHGTSAALEFGIRVLKVKHLILLGHSQCGGIQALLEQTPPPENDFISDWVSLIKQNGIQDLEQYAKRALMQSYQHCLSFPWIKSAVDAKELALHEWFFDIKTGQIFTADPQENAYYPLDAYASPCDHTL
jgi:carbonic anhydrase